MELCAYFAFPTESGIVLGLKVEWRVKWHESLIYVVW